MEMGTMQVTEEERCGRGEMRKRRDTEAQRRS
jgi:hypothetical protein